ncbi:hypothetical protein, partial [Pseudomonas quasicaspiana]
TRSGGVRPDEKSERISTQRVGYGLITTIESPTVSSIPTQAALHTPPPTKENCPYPALTGIMSVIINNKLNERSMALPRDAVTT